MSATDKLPCYVLKMIHPESGCFKVVEVFLTMESAQEEMKRQYNFGYDGLVEYEIEVSTVRK